MLILTPKPYKVRSSRPSEEHLTPAHDNGYRFLKKSHALRVGTHGRDIMSNTTNWRTNLIERHHWMTFLLPFWCS